MHEMVLEVEVVMISSIKGRRELYIYQYRVISSTVKNPFCFAASLGKILLVSLVYLRKAFCDACRDT